MCAQLHFNIRKEGGVKLDKEHWDEHVPKLVETSHEDKVTYCKTNKRKPTEPSIIIINGAA